MALTLDTTVGGASANAYVDATYVDGIADELFPVPDGYLNLTTDEKNRAIRQLTLRVDQESLRGQRATTTQALEFPRTQAPKQAEWVGTAPYGFSGPLWEDSTTIPDRVKRAVAVGVILLAGLTAAGEIDPFAPSDNVGVGSVSLGAEMSVSFTGGIAANLPAFEQVFAQRVRPLLGTLVTSPQARLLRG